MTILDKIIATKRTEVAQAKALTDESTLRSQLKDAPPVRDFFGAIANDSADDGTNVVSLIAEIKKASPSEGLIRADFDPVQIGQIYQAAGARCLSVLTDRSYFQGELSFLSQVRTAVDIPILRKDFILDSIQVLEARVAGADAVLLIAECLDDCNLRKLHNEIVELDMTPLVEFYEPENLPRILEAGATLVGCNNRNLKTMTVDIEHTIRMRSHVPAECLMVGESGINSPEDVRQLQAAGVDAMLVGTSLMRQDDIASAVRKLLS